MEPVHLAVAFCPLGIYIAWLGFVYLRRRPVVLTGTLDVALLAAGVLGLAIAGPLELILPAQLPFPGPFVWLLVLMMYGLIVTLWNLLARPRLVILNATVEQVRPLLVEIAARLDGNPQWAGDSVALADTAVQLHIEDYPAMRTVSLIALGRRQSDSGWRRLRLELIAALEPVQAADRGRGYAMFIVGVLMFLQPLVQLCQMTGPAVAHRLADMLRL